jgi:hypothetical protein
VCFSGLAIAKVEAADRPPDAYAGLVARLHGNVLLTRSWHDLKH